MNYVLMGTYFLLYIKRLSAVIVSLLYICITEGNLYAQFTVKENFTENTIPANLVIGGSAKLTAATGIDPLGSGWLRLTDTIKNQVGYCYINQSIPSSLGVLIEFEYTVWNSSAAIPEADGFSFFLFDASYGPGTFTLGRDGGALGYGEVDNKAQPSGWSLGAGLTGGYVGIGLDEFGNYSSKQTQNDNSAPGLRAQSIALRGASNAHTTYLAGTDANLGGTVYAGQTIGYGPPTTLRPAQDVFYRKMQILLDKAGSNYQITVYMQLVQNGSMMPVFGPITLSSAPPANLKLGFAATTGSAYAAHEVRNLLATTPGGVHVEKYGPLTAANGDTVNYTVNVYNDSKNPQAGIPVIDTLPGNFQLSNITFSNEGYPGNTYDGAGTTTNNIFSGGTVSLAASSRGKFTFQGKLSFPDSNAAVLRNTAIAKTPAGFLDPDESNDTARFYTYRKPVIHPLINQSVCSGSPISIPLQTMNSARLQWAVTTTGNVTGATAGSAVADATGKYTLNPVPVNTGNTPAIITYTFTPSYNYTSPENGVTTLVPGDPVSVTITLHPLPVLTSSTTQPVICSGQGFSYTPAGNIAGATYTWTRDIVTGISNPAASGSGAINETLINTTSTATVNVLYRLTLTDPSTGCTNLQTVTVPVKPAVLASAITTSDASVCPNVAAALTASSSVTGVTYNWYSNPALTGPVLAKGATYTTPKLTANTSYYVTAQSSSVCENIPGTAKQVTVTVSDVCGNLTPAGCSASGSLLYFDDFGGNQPAAPNYSSTPLPGGRTTYTFAAGASKFPPQTDQYSLTKNPNSNGFAQWYTNLTDHTGTGYMAIFNADLAPKTFYTDTLKNLCSGTKLFFSAWAISMFRNATGGINPNLTFILSDPVTGQVVSTLFTGDIVNGDKNWRQYGLNFTVPSGLSSIALSIKNNAPGGTGNDVALDDIGVYACLPPVVITGLKPGGNYCPGEILNLTANYTDDGSLGSGFVYQWYYSATGDLTSWASWSQVPGANSNMLSTPAATGYYRVVVGNSVNINTGNFNCCAISNIAQVTVNPGPNVNPITGAATVCAGGNTVLVNTTAGGTWSSSNTAVATIDPATGNVTGIASGSTTINYTVIGTTGGCSTIVSAPMIVNPLPVVNTVSNQESCADNAGTNMTTPVIFAGNLPGTVFNWSMNNAIGYNPTGSGNIPAFGYYLPAGAGPLTSTVTVTPAANGCNGVPITFTYTANPYPNTAASVSNASQCLRENNFVFTNTTSIPGNGTLTYVWNFDDGTVLTTAGATHSFSTSGTHVYTLTARSAKGCSYTFTGSVAVLPQPSASFTYAVISPNTNDNFSFTNTSTSPSGIAGMSYFWDFGDGSTSVLQNPTHAYTANGTYNVTLTVTNAEGCSASVSQTIVVDKNPNIAADFMINNAGQCLSGNSFAFTNTTTTSNGISVTAYLWDFGDGNTSGTASPVHVYALPGSYTVTLTATSSTGFQDVVTQSVNVYAVPNVGKPADQVVCNNSITGAVLFTSTVGNPSYNWSNNNTSIGLAANGAGNIPAFTAGNTGNVPITATITITPTQNACAGIAQSFTITVNPTPSVSSVANQTVCTGLPVTAVNFTGNVSGTTFTWANNNTSIGLPASGTDNIASFTAVNTGSSIQVADITILATASGCTGNTGNFSITVNPVPALTSPTGAEGICSGTSFGYTPTNSIAGTLYSWRRLAVPGIAEAVSSGTGSINEILTNTTTSLITVSYEYISTSPAGCTHTDTVTAKINPVPIVAPPPVSVNACNNALVNPAAFSSNIPNVTFIWSNNNTAIGLPSAGTGNIAPFVASNTNGTPITANISVVAVGNYVAFKLLKDAPPVLGCTSSPQNFTITVNPVVTVNQLNDTTVCPGAQIAMPAFTGSGVPGTVYNWTLDQSIGLPLSGTGNLPAFIAVNTTVSPVSATVTVTPEISGCAGASIASKITVNPTIVPDFSINNPIQCLSGNNFVFTDHSLAGANLSYAWSFGDGGTSALQSPSYNYAVAGVYNVTLTANVAGSGCNAVSVSKNVTVNVMPTADFIYTIISPNTNDEYQFTAKSYISTGNIAGYYWNFGDGVTSGDINPVHAYANSGIYTVTLTVTSDNGCSATILQNLTVTKDPNLKAGFTVNNAGQCFTNNSFLFNNTTTIANGAVIASYAWDFGDGIGTASTANAAYVYTNPGTYTVTLTVTTSGGYSDIVTQSVTVYPTPQMSTPNNQVVCAGSMTTIVRFKPIVTGLTFTWTNDRSDIGLPGNGSGGSIPAFAASNATNAPIAATITVTPSANGCTGITQSFTITVNPTPSVTGYANQVICAGSTTTAVNFTSSVTGTTFTWVNDNTTIGIAASGTGNVASVTALNTGSSPQVSNITVTPSASGCSGTGQSFSITVNPLPTLTSSLDAGSICSGNTFHYTPQSLVSGVTYNWSRAAVAGIGNLPAAGIGDPNEILTNTTALPITVTYTYTLTAGGCAGANVYNVQVQVNPLAILSSSLTPPSICNNTLFNYVPASSTPGTNFAWSRPADAYNSAASGTGNPFEVLHNGGTAPITVTYAYTPTANGCTGPVQNVQVQVNPNPNDDFSSNSPQCLNGNNFVFNLNPNSGAANYAWDFGDGSTATGTGATHSYTGAGLYPVTLTVISGSGCVRTVQHTVLVNPSPVAQFVYNTIAPNSNDNYQFTDKSIIGSGALAGYVWDFGDGITSTTQNPTHAYAASGTYIVRLTITSLSGCAATITEMLIVNNGPNVTAGFTINNPAQCISGNSFVFTDATTTAAGITVTGYTWDFGDGSPVNNTQNPTHVYTAAGTYVVKQHVTGTDGVNTFSADVTQTVIVHATPDMQQPGDQVVCNQAGTAPIFFRPIQSGLSFNWMMATDIGAGTSGTGNIPSFTANNPGNTAVNTTVTVTPVANGCAGVSKTFMITVNPTPTVTGFGNQAVCAGSATAGVNFTSSVSGTTFTWVNDNTTTGIPASGTGSIASVVGFNVGISPEVSHINVTPSATGCAGTGQNFSITVNPLPVMTSSLAGGSICSGTAFNYSPTSNTSGTVFNWSRAAVPGIGNTAAAGTGNPNEVLNNTTASPVPVTYIYSVTASGCTSASTYNVRVIVYPAASLSSSLTPPAICSGSLFSYLPASNTAGVSFAWSRAAIAGIGNAAANGTGNPNEVLTNTTSLPITVTYAYTLTAAGCASAVQNVQVQVNPLPTAAFTVNNPVQCLNGNSFVYSNTSTIGAGTLTYTWDLDDGTLVNTQDVTHTYTVDGVYAVKLTALSNSGCSASVMQNVSVLPSPVAGFIYTVIAPNSNDEYLFTNTSTITAGTLTYLWDFGDATTSTDPNPIHSYTTSGIYVVRLTVTGSGGCLSTISENLIVSKKPNIVPGFTVNTATQCVVGNNFVFTNTTTSAAGNGAVAYTWDFGDGTPTTNVTDPTHTYTAAGAYIVSLTVTGARGYTAVLTQSVLVYPTPNMVPQNNQIICAGSATTNINFSGSVTSAIYNWTNDHPEIGLAASGTGNIVSFITSNTTGAPIIATISITPISRGCSGPSTNFTITVNPMPTLTGVSNQILCNGQSTTAVHFVGNVAATVFNWQNTNTTIGLTANGTGDIPSFVASSNGYAANIGTIRVMPIANGCQGNLSSFAINVNPLPDVSSVQTNAMCDSTVFNYTPVSHVAGTSFAWTRAVVPGISNPAASGTGNPNEVLKNTTGLPVNVSYAYTVSATGCSSTQNVIVTVNPRPKLSNYTAPPIICNNTAFNYTPASTTPGTIFYWIRDEVQGIVNPPAYGTDNPNEVLSNTSVSPIYVTYAYTLSAAGCYNTYNVGVKVNPIPVMTSTATPTPVCSGTGFTYSPASATLGVSFTWARAAVPGIGNAAATGTGNISETLVNTTSNAVNVTYVYSLTYNGCTAVQNVSVTVNPTPVISTPLSNIISCAGQNINAIALAGTVPGTVYNWVNNNTIVGLQSNGTGNIPGFTAQNPYTEVIFARVAVNPITPAGCTLPVPANYTIQINPLPSGTVTAPLGTTLCTGSSVPLIATGGNTYQWYNAGNSISGATSAQLVVTTGGIYSVSISTAQGCSVQETGNVTVAQIQKPKADFSYNAYCINTPVTFSNNSIVNNSGVVSYVWTDNAGHTSTLVSPVFTYGLQGNYTMQLKVVPQLCPTLIDSISKTLPVEVPQPGIRLTTVNTVANSPVQLQARNIGSSSYLWVPATGLNDATIADPLATLTGDQEYLINMTLPSACVTTDTVLVRVLGDDLIFIPNVLTPNGDGKNDNFFITGLSKYPGSELSIYNRWQNQVYHSANYANDWQGEGLNPGTYYYLLKLHTTTGIKVYKGWVLLEKK